MTPALEADALEQLRLRYRLPASAADSYVEAGFTVVLDYVIAGSSSCTTRSRRRRRAWGYGSTRRA